MDKKKILLVDDEMDIRLTLEKGLIIKGYSVITADNGNDGVSLARLKHPDLIILDRALGDMLGEETAEILKKDPRTNDIPIIFISALFSKKEEIENYHLFGDHKMFAKPYDMGELVAVIEEIFGEKQIKAE